MPEAGDSPERSSLAEPGSSRGPAILLLGHGSHINGLSSDSVHELARELRATGRHPEVRVAFWKEEPQLRHAFLLVESPEVVAVPFFTSEGYFTDRVLPRELRIDPPVSEVWRVVGPGEGEEARTRSTGTRSEDAGDEHSTGPGHPLSGPGHPPSAPGHPRLAELDDPVRVHYTRAVGAHPAMADAILERARDRLMEEGPVGDGPAPVDETTSDRSFYAETTLVVLGHGTERHPASGEIVERLTEELARTSPFAAVTCCFLDQDPRMLPVLESVHTPRAVMVPFFMAEGWHVGETIPRDLKLEEGRSRVGGVEGSTEVLYADPVGTHPSMVRVVEEMVTEAIEEGAKGRDDLASHGPIEGESASAPAPALPSLPLPLLPARAREAFVEWIDAAGDGGRTFLQTRVRRTSPSSTGDAGLDGHGGSGGSDSDRALAGDRPTRYEIRHVDDADLSPADLERSADPERARIVAARTDAGDHRPLKTAPDLPRGWLLEELSARDVWEAYAHLYPVAPVHWYLGHEGALPVIPFRETAERQTGIYRIIQELDDSGVEEIRAELCAEGCLRRVRWPLRGKGGIAQEPATESELLCPEACSLFVTLARERAAGGDGHHGHD